LFDGGDSIIAYGFCWSKSENPTISDNKITVAPGSETNFITQISGLIENTTYYVRAFAANSEGIGYGNVISFTTQNINNNPILFNPNLTYGTVTVKTACNPVCKTKKLLVIY
jgi:hypothetical protein